MTAGSGFDFMAFLPIILIFIVFYFLLIRPQQKKMKSHQDMIANLRRGDKIVTNGGLIGTVVKLTSDRELQVEIAENVRVRILRTMIAEVLAKTEPTNAEQQPETTIQKQTRAKKSASNADKKD
jgi:preprotein translocase subunit YajC